MSIGKEPSRRELVNQTRGDDQIPKPETGKEDLAETSRENDGPTSIEPLEGRHRPSRVPIFAVVVVLENPRSFAARPLQQGQSPIQWHGYTEGKLMGRGHVY